MRLVLLLRVDVGTALSLAQGGAVDIYSLPLWILKTISAIPVHMMRAKRKSGISGIYRSIRRYENKESSSLQYTREYCVIH